MSIPEAGVELLGNRSGSWPVHSLVGLMRRALGAGGPAMLLCALALAAAGSAPASAQQPAPAEPSETMAQSTTTETDMADAQARGHFRLGREYYEQGRFADAAKEFEAAYGLSGA